jgi:hypothetical protein
VFGDAQMPKHFNGMVSRFSSGQRDTALHTAAQISIAATQLRRLGVSHLGAQQLLAGQTVTNADDRQKFGRFITHLVLNE